jgi:AraC-like DNA-binding protein
MTVETATGTWVLPPHRALWAPEAIPFQVRMHGRVSVRTLYFRSDLRVLAAELRVVNVPPLVRELILAAVGEAPLDLDEPRQRRLVDVLVDRLAPLPQAPLQLPLPADPRARALAERLAGPYADETIDDAARACGASRRTMERLFVAETGMAIAAWRRRSRFLDALQLLASGEPVTAVAGHIGYATPSAFSYAFRRHFGEAPGDYFRA